MTVASEQTASETRVMYTRCPALPNVSHLAHRLGLVQAEVAGEPGLAVDEVIGGDTHVAGYRYWLRHAGYAKPLWARIGGADTVLVAVSRHETACPVYVRADAGFDTPAGLRGKRVALVADRKLPLDYNRIIYLQTYVAALTAGGLSWADVTPVDVEVDRQGLMRRTGLHFADIAKSTNADPANENLFTEIAKQSLILLLRGEVDAIAGNLPAEIVSFFGLIKIYDSRGDDSIDARHDLRCLVVSGAFVREQRALLVRLLARLLEASRHARTAPADAIRHLANDLRIAPAVLVNDSDDVPGGMNIDASAQSLAMLTAKKDLLRVHGLIDRDFDVTEWLDASLLGDAQELAASFERGAGRRSRMV